MTRTCAVGRIRVRRSRQRVSVEVEKFGREAVQTILNVWHGRSPTGDEVFSLLLQGGILWLENDIARRATRRARLVCRERVGGVE